MTTSPCTATSTSSATAASCTSSAQPLGANADYLIVPGRDGTRARLWALPFIFPHRMTTVPGTQSWSSNYREQLADLSADRSRPTDGWDPRSEVTVFAAHVHATRAGLPAANAPGTPPGASNHLCDRLGWQIVQTLRPVRVPQPEQTQ
jgi:hypothetical protein